MEADAMGKPVILSRKHDLFPVRNVLSNSALDLVSESQTAH